MTERELLEKLLLTGHLNVPERKQLKNGKANVQIMVDIIAGILTLNGRFPKQTKLEDVLSGGLIIKTSDSFFHVCRKAEVSIHRYEVVSEEIHPDAMSAASAYLRLCYDGNIDGVIFE